MARCGCASDRCDCVITAGPGVAITGTGTASNPYVITSDTEGSVLQILDTPTIDLTLTGNGTAGTPFILSAQNITQMPVRQIFDTSGTWNKPIGARYFHIEVQGAGGGGGGAGITAAGQASVGAGGGSGGRADAWLDGTVVSASESIEVGVAGGGGSGAASGSAGGASWFRTALFVGASGGNGGASVAATSGNGFAAGGTNGLGIGFPTAMVFDGVAGHSGRVLAGGVAAVGRGGHSFWTGGGLDGQASTGASGGSAEMGAGGGGAVNGPSQGSTRSGGIGGTGFVIVTSFF